MNIRITGASAGTGKTYHLCTVIVEALTKGGVDPGSVIATTFTKKAAAELRDRVRQRLLQAGKPDLAQRIDESLIGTVHGICARILERFAFEAGISPRLRIMDETLEGILLSQSVEACFTPADISEMETLSHRLTLADARKGDTSWRKHVREIISAARANAIEADQFTEMARKSMEEMLAFLPEPVGKKPEAALQTAISAALGAIEENGDETATTKKCVDELKQALSDLRSGRMKWSGWCKLAKLKAAKASIADVLGVHEAAAGVESHPGLHQDLRRYIERVFALAGSSLSAYQACKEARGMLDYADLEVRCLGLLKLPTVKQCLREEYSLLLVDEFQDTSPIQLELFLRLADLVRDTHWVGDTKQAIYGFRGCDPELMRLAEQQLRSGKSESLATSFRHRPELKDFFNGLFPAVFATTHGMPAAEVEIKATSRKTLSKLPAAIEHWALGSDREKKDGSPSAINVEEVVACVAKGIRQLKEADYQVGDKRSDGGDDGVRPLRWGDIAVLCRSNDKASAIAARLAALGVPAARSTKGLLATPEAVLAVACLRWLNDDGDSVAAAEILSLESCRDTEVWLEDRIRWVAEKRDGHWGLDGGINSPVLRAIDALRVRIKLLTPAELLDSVLALADLAGIASHWGPDSARAAQRRSNLESLRGLACEYESECLSAGSAASHAGFLLWCEALASAGQDMTAFDVKADAVQVLTWHGAKGLEWPVVICLGLEDKPRPRIWSTPLVYSTGAFDPSAPLANRQIRFWPYPFGQQTGDVSLFEKVEASNLGQDAARAAERESARLLYVALTRARDVLIFPLAGKKAPWLPSGASCPDFDFSTREHPARCRTLRHLTPDADPRPADAEKVPWFPTPLPPHSRLPAELIPSGLSPLPGAKVEEVLTYGPPIDISGNPDEQALGNAFHAILAAAILVPGREDLEPVIQRILQEHGVAADVRQVKGSLLAFRQCLETHCSPTDWLVEVPFSTTNPDGQQVRGFMDLVLLTAKGALLVDHKSFRGDGLEKCAISYSGQLAAYRDALTVHGHRAASVWVHFCTQGKLTRISWQELHLESRDLAVRRAKEPRCRLPAELRV